MEVHETVHSEARCVQDSPFYRVNFWERPSLQHAWNLESYVLTGATDVQEVLVWAREEARGRRFEVLIEQDVEALDTFEKPRTSTLIRLLGSDPN